MLRTKSGFQAYVKKQNPNAKGVHCMIHRHALASKTLPPPLRKVLDQTIQMVNFVKGGALIFWPLMCGSYPNVTKKAIQDILPFVSTYLCESWFSALLQIKTTQRNRLDVENDMRCALSTTFLRIHELSKKKKTITSIPLNVKICIISAINFFCVLNYSILLNISFRKIIATTLVLIKLKAKELINCEKFSVLM